MDLGHRWRRASDKHPCPICSKGDWCTISADGRLAACRRNSAGAWKEKTAKDGTVIYLHRLDGTAIISTAELPPVPSSSTIERADADTMHRVYSALLAALALSKAHRESLRVRGLPEDAIDQRQYRSLSVQGRSHLAGKLQDQFGDAVLRVPGFSTKKGKNGPYLTLTGAAGLLVPVRDVAGRIIALKVRRDGDSVGPRYSYLSSVQHGGAGPGSPVHVPLGVTAPCQCLRVTEGELKADVATVLSGLPTVSIPGAGAWRAALDSLKALDSKTARVALDADALDNEHVARHLADFAEVLDGEGFSVELERWPAKDKGIDDALVAGAAVELLTGDAARKAIADILAEATAGEPVPEPSPLDRLAEVLNEGPEAIYRNGDLLRALAALAEGDRAEFACKRAAMQRAGVKLRDLDAALAPHRQELRRQHPPILVVGAYRVAEGCIVHQRSTQQGPVEVPLANWSGRIVGETVHDDGADRRITYAVVGALADGTPLPRAEVPADRFAGMRWPVEVWGMRAVVYAGSSTADHLRAALQLFSADVPRRVVFEHSGWRDVGGKWVYLHAAGAIGQPGTVEGVEVQLPDALARFELPAPPRGAALVEAVRASLRILDLAPDRITVPLLAAVYRAVVGAADFGLHLAGPTGAGKTELAALVQQHFGQTLDARHLPGSWASTGNALEGLAFAAKDALLTVDDFNPTGSMADVQRFHREADRLLRAQGNWAGRGRCRADGTVKAGRPPRGTILSTGEDVPKGQSLRARLLVLEISPGDVELPRLTPYQRDACNGLYAAALAGYLRWLAPRYAELSAGLKGETDALRERVQTEGLHARTPGIVADLAAGLNHFLDFAFEAGAIDTVERETLSNRCWTALLTAGAEQAQHVQAAEPCGQFLRLLADALASGRAHVVGLDGGKPANAAGWGWRRGDKEDWEAHGRRIGWIDGADLYLAPEAAYAEAQELARHQGDALPVSPRTLWKRCRERGLLASWDPRRQRYSVRRTLEGVKDRQVIHLPHTVLYCAEPSELSAMPESGQIPAEKRTVSTDGLADSNGHCPQHGPQETSAKHGENAVGGRFGRSKEGIEGHTPVNNSPSKRRRGTI
jgi:hypothetical protein